MSHVRKLNESFPNARTVTMETDLKWIYIHTHIYSHINIYIYLYIHIYIYIHMYTYIYIHTYIYTHTYMYIYLSVSADDIRKTSSRRVTESTLQHTATHCNTLQHTATHYNTRVTESTQCRHVRENTDSVRSSRLLKITGPFCKRALSKRLYSAKETYDFKEPTNHSHLIGEVGSLK